jgi:hypothetical protein
MNDSNLNGDTPTVTQALRALGPREREELTAAAFASALEALPEADRAALRRMTRDLSEQWRGIGERMALSVLGAIGVLWAGRP